jgi:hypothetical protein
MTNPAVMALIIVQTLMLSNPHRSCQLLLGPRSPAWIWAAAAANDSAGGAAGAAGVFAAGAGGAAGVIAGAATAAGVFRVANVQSSALWTVQKL